MTHPCTICGAHSAGLGFRLPGLRSEIPPAKRGYGWACAGDCADALEARWAKATKPKPDEPKQGSLL